MTKSRKQFKSLISAFNSRVNNDWSKDDSKIGQKLLEKMGWRKGQGLGSKNQGITECVKVPLKLDSKGLGFKINDDQWVAVEHGFAEVLAQLSQDNDSRSIQSAKPNSLALKSLTSKSGVHYHKYVRGKDISRYNANDLAGILGRTSKQPNDNNIVEHRRKDDVKNVDGNGLVSECYLHSVRKLKKRKTEKSDCGGSISPDVTGQSPVKLVKNYTQICPQNISDDISGKPKKKKIKLSVSAEDQNYADVTAAKSIQMNQIEDLDCRNVIENEGAQRTTTCKKRKRKFNHINYDESSVNEKVVESGKKNSIEDIGCNDVILLENKKAETTLSIRKKKKQISNVGQSRMEFKKNNKKEVEDSPEELICVDDVNKLVIEDSSCEHKSNITDTNKRSKKKVSLSGVCCIEEITVGHQHFSDTGKQGINTHCDEAIITEYQTNINGTIVKSKKKKQKSRDYSHGDVITVGYQKRVGDPANNRVKTQQTSDDDGVLIEVDFKRKRKEKNYDSSTDNAMIIENQDLKSKKSIGSKENTSENSKSEENCKLLTVECNIEKQNVLNENERNSQKTVYRILSKAERIVQKNRLLRKMQSQDVEHAFKGSNLIKIRGYGNHHNS